MASFSEEYIRAFIAEAVDQKQATRIVEGDSADAQSLIERLRKYRSYVGTSRIKRKVIGPGWRTNKRKIGWQKYRVYLFSPDSTDMPPELYPPKPKPKEQRQKRVKYFPDWVIDNLASQSMNHITVIPYEDFKRLGSKSVCERVLIHLVQKRMKREDVRVIVTQVKGGRKPWYNARLIFLEEGHR